MEVTPEIQNRPFYTTSPTGALVIDSTVTYNSVTYSVTSIGISAFVGCSGLTSVIIPNSVTSIGNNAFEGCSGFTSLTIPNSVTSIGNYAFYSCTGLTVVTIPDSVTSIGIGAFYGSNTVMYCGNATGSPWGALNAGCFLAEGDFIYSDSTKTTLVGYTGSSSNVTIPNSVTSIGNSAFEGCSWLTSVTIPNSVTSIGNYAFYNCTGLTIVTIPDSVTSIGNSAFYYCTGVTSITIPNSVTSIGEYAFSRCYGLTSVTIGNSVTNIGRHVFSGCSGLTSIAIPNSVTSIGDFAFIGCSLLTTVTIGNSVTSIGNYAFEDCSELTSVTIPDSVTSIGDGAFADCSGLTSVTIGNSVTSIGILAFIRCSGLTSITSKAVSAPTIGSNTFSGVSDSIPISIPCGSVSSYDTIWTMFSNFVEDYSLPYSFQCRSNDTVMGFAAALTQPSCSAPNAVVIAAANSGYRFVQWSDGSTANPYVLTVTGDTIITAMFSRDPSYHDTIIIHDTTIVHDTVTIPCNMDYYTLTVTALQQQGIAVGSGVFSDSTVVEIAAIPLQGFHFTAWADCDNQNPRHVMVTGDATYTAVFDADPVGIGNAEACPYTITTDRENITVHGAQGQRIRIFDAMGHLLATENHPTERHTFRMPASGTYLVQVADRPAQKAVVIK